MRKLLGILVLLLAPAAMAQTYYAANNINTQGSQATGSTGVGACSGAGCAVIVIGGLAFDTKGNMYFGDNNVGFNDPLAVFDTQTSTLNGNDCVSIEKGAYLTGQVNVVDAGAPCGTVALGGNNPAPGEVAVFLNTNPLQIEGSLANTQTADMYAAAIGSTGQTQFNSSGLLTNYDGITTAGLGHPVTILIDTTGAITSATGTVISARSLLASGSSTGWYRIHQIIATTTAGTGTCATPGTVSSTLAYADNLTGGTGAAVMLFNPSTTSATAVFGSLGETPTGLNTPTESAPVEIYFKTGTALTYTSVGVANSCTTTKGSFKVVTIIEQLTAS